MANLEFFSARVTAFWAFSSGVSNFPSSAPGQPKYLTGRTGCNKLCGKKQNKRSKPQVFELFGGFHYGCELAGIIPKR